MRRRLLLAAAVATGSLGAACGADGNSENPALDPAGAGGAPSGWGGAQSGAGGTPGPDAGGTAGAPSGTGGLAVVSPPPGGRPYDPDGNVNFDWPEGVSSGTTCKAGRYVGTFECAYAPSAADGGVGAPTGFVVLGPVEFTLSQSQNGELLEVNGGTLNGAALLAIAFTANLVGQLNCQTGEFTGSVTDGEYGLPPPPPPLVPGPPLGFFSGPTSATYSAQGPALINGVWGFEVQDAQGNTFGSCPGKWSATLTP